jgi:outer membrane protein assembly factor BamB
VVGFAFPFVVGFFVACGGTVPTPDSADSQNEDSTVEVEPLIRSISLKEIEGAPLARQVLLELALPAAIRLEYWQEEGPHFERRFPEGGLTLDLALIGMRASQESHLVVHADADSQSESSEVIDFSTGALDFELPLDVGGFSERPSDGSMVVFGFDASVESGGFQFVGVDRGGQVVWAYRDNVTPKTKGVPLEVLGGDQFFHINLHGGVWVDAFGQILRQIEFSETVHHDAALLPNGSGVFIVRNKQRVETDEWGSILVRAGALVEVDSASQEVWRWDAFDHLDLASVTKPNNGTSDWTHLNSVQFLPDSDQLLLGARNQSQAYLVDHATGDVVWTLGEGGDFELIEGEWFKFQHDVSMLTDGSVLMLDNGNTKPVDENTRAVRYALDLEAMTAREIWSVDVGLRMGTMGSVQILDSGNTLICLGGNRTRGLPAAIVEANPAGEEVWRLEVPDGDSPFSIYRSRLVDFAQVVSD